MKRSERMKGRKEELKQKEKEIESEIRKEKEKKKIIEIRMSITTDFINSKAFLFILYW